MPPFGLRINSGHAFPWLTRIAYGNDAPSALALISTRPALWNSTSTLDCSLMHKRRFRSLLRFLQLRLHEGQRLFVIGFAGERFGNDELVPGVENPGTFDGNEEAENWCARHARQMNRAWFGNVTRATW